MPGRRRAAIRSTSARAGGSSSLKRLDREADVRPVEAADDDRGVAHREALDDLLAHGRRRRRGEGEDGRAAERLGRGAQAQVVRPEVMAPLRDAVRLVDHQQRRPGDGELVEHVRVRELLRRQEEELELLVGELGERLVAVGGADGRVELGGAAGGPLPQILDLVALEGDQRGDDHGRALDQQPGDLVDRRLPGARRHDREGVAAVRRRIASSCPGRSASSRRLRGRRPRCGRRRLRTPRAPALPGPPKTGGCGELAPPPRH
jgi:hypothetical protein